MVASCLPRIPPDFLASHHPTLLLTHPHSSTSSRINRGHDTFTDSNNDNPKYILTPRLHLLKPPSPTPSTPASHLDYGRQKTTQGTTPSTSWHVRAPQPPPNRRRTSATSPCSAHPGAPSLEHKRARRTARGTATVPPSCGFDKHCCCCCGYSAWWWPACRRNLIGVGAARRSASRPAGTACSVTLKPKMPYRDSGVRRFLACSSRQYRAAANHRQCKIRYAYLSQAPHALRASKQAIKQATLPPTSLGRGWTLSGREARQRCCSSSSWRHRCLLSWFEWGNWGPLGATRAAGQRIKLLLDVGLAEPPSQEHSQHGGSPPRPSLLPRPHPGARAPVEARRARRARVQPPSGELALSAPS